MLITHLELETRCFTPGLWPSPKLSAAFQPFNPACMVGKDPARWAWAPVVRLVQGRGVSGHTTFAFYCISGNAMF